ncbi:hypothetical protein AJ79_05119 [Helicocarpus griseus UAMH5409]|uniref:Altered inheritance of mitochondria protein 9, mitochondrial n=1 Tax=Helicocarpus griseus UAMH5409 TaxID=1447875 RepID=A0A2B7XRE7_9EURO|nr:hypothetical protein AJ79_05119 [Helicocarpus griseus UAMH5409]
MDNGKEVIGKVPNPNAGIPHYTAASEVATMDFMRNTLQTPVPEVYAWNSRIEGNSVRAEYIIMEKSAGIPLAHIWNSLKITEKFNKLAALDLYSQLLPMLLPSESEPELNTGHLWHNDLQYENIYMNPDKPNEILGIIDWQAVEIMPLYDQALDPAFLGYEGPDIGEDLSRPKLDVTSLDEVQKQVAYKNFDEKALIVGWRMAVKAKSPDHYKAIQFSNSTAGHLLSLSKNISILGEAHFRALLLDPRDEWGSASRKFPL